MVAFHHPPPIRPVRYLLSIGRCVVDVWSTQGGTETHCNTTALNLDLARSDRLKARQTRPMAAEHERRGRGTGCPEVTLLSAEHLNPGSWSALLVPNPLSIVHTAMYDKSQSSMWYVCYTYVGYCVDERGTQDLVLIIGIFNFRKRRCCHDTLDKKQELKMALGDGSRSFEFPLLPSANACYLKPLVACYLEFLR